MTEEIWGEDDANYSQPSVCEQSDGEEGRPLRCGIGRGSIFNNYSSENKPVGRNTYKEQNDYTSTDRSGSENYRDDGNNRYNGNRFEGDRTRFGNRSNRNENNSDRKRDYRNNVTDDNEHNGDYKNDRRNAFRGNRNDTFPRKERGYGRNGDEGGYNRNDENNENRNPRRKYNDDNKGDKNAGDKPKNREIYIPPEQSNDEQSLFGNDLTMGINFNKYESIEVKVSGENVPPPIQSFEQADLRHILIDNIKKSGYTKPTPVQKHAIPIIKSGRDLMACAQTGSGKTAAFVVPIINKLLEDQSDANMLACEPHAVIISPTRELTVQIYHQVRKFASKSVLRVHVVYGGTSVAYQTEKVTSGCHILVATPGRLLDFLGRNKIKLCSLRFLVLDEADRMLDMGFLPDIERILDHDTITSAENRQMLMFSATFPNEIQELAGRFLKNYLFLAVGIVGGACTDVEQVFYQTSGQSEKRKFLKEIIETQTQAGNRGGILVFVEQKRQTDFIAAFLSESNFPTTSIHGDRLQREREEALSDFKQGRMSVLVATAVAARGLDIKNVAHVINFDLPKSIDEYVHRIGRTGRVGNRGKATSFFDESQDMPLTQDLVKILRQASQPIPDWLGSGDGSSSRTLPSGRGSRQFGGTDIRRNNEEYRESYHDDGAYASSVQAEPEEMW